MKQLVSLLKSLLDKSEKMYSVLGDDNSGHEKAKGLNKNAVASIRHNKYKDFLLNQKCL